MPRLAKEMHEENDDLGNVQRNKAWHFILAVIGASALSASLHLIVKSSKNDSKGMLIRPITAILKAIKHKKPLNKLKKHYL